MSQAAKKNLRKGRDFLSWMDIARSYDEARREAMQRAGTSQPQGSAYREEFAKIDRRERLINRDENGKEFPSPEDRTYCIKVLENYDAPSYDPRRPSIKAWRDKLLDSERAKVNHPKRVWDRYWTDTEPMAEKEAERWRVKARRVVREIERCRSAIGRARDVAPKLEKRFPGVVDELESMLELLVCVAEKIDPDKPKGRKPKKGKKDKRRKEEERPQVTA